jgi:PhnB protein
MKNINSYLTFNGNCREAMNFYRDCLGGEVAFQTIGESPMAGQLPAHMKNQIMHSTLSSENIILMGSDMCDDRGRISGNAVSMLLNCTSEEEIRECYGKLSEGGEQTHQIEKTFWGALFGNLTDRYGNHWLLHYQL